jgi:hypothetical protein
MFKEKIFKILPPTSKNTDTLLKAKFAIVTLTTSPPTLGPVLSLSNSVMTGSAVQRPPPTSTP